MGWDGMGWDGMGWHDMCDADGMSLIHVQTTSATDSELVCPGGEQAFVERMMRQSATRKQQIRYA